MDLSTATLLVNGIIALMGALPQIIASIQTMDAPEEDKELLIARVKKAQDEIRLLEWK